MIDYDWIMNRPLRYVMVWNKRLYINQIFPAQIFPFNVQLQTTWAGEINTRSNVHALP